MAGYAITAKDLVAVKPVRIGDRCPDCNGTGRVGDGTVMTDCLRCGADGRIDEDDIEAAKAAKPPKQTEPEVKPVKPVATEAANCSTEEGTVIRSGFS